MKRKLFFSFLFAEAVVCMLLHFVVQEELPEIMFSAFSFPFDQIGQGLRELSLSGDLGNAAAIILYAIFCLIPVFLFIIVWRKRCLHFEDSFLVILSAVLFAVLYWMINPGMMGKYFGSIIGQDIGKTILGGTIYSILFSYITLRILRSLFTAEAKKMYRYLSVLLCALMVLFVYEAFGICFDQVLNNLKTLLAEAEDQKAILISSIVILTSNYIVNVLPYVLDIFVSFAALRLVDEIRLNRYSEGTVMAAGRLSRLCSVSLMIVTLFNIGFHLIQLLLFRNLNHTSVSINIPLLTIAFIFAVLLLAQFVGENKKLKDDNDMFI